MAALAAARNTVSKADPRKVEYSWKQKGATTVYQGSLVALNAGFAAPGATAASRIAVGRALETSVNSGADGAVNVRVEQGVFKYVNDPGDLLAQADVGATVYITDDQTVSKTATGKSIAGKLMEVETDGVWVAIFV